MPTCPRCGRAAPDEAAFCSACGARLTGNGPAAAQARKTVTVIFADVSGFTALGERLDPESLQQVIARYFAEMRQVVARHGGSVEKLIGDAVMAVFGVPVLHEDDALRAARAALEMRDALEVLNEALAQQWDVRLQTHTGLNTGEVVVSDSADGGSLTYGDTVNVAQRLEAAAAPGEILVGSVTARLLQGVGRLTAVRPLRVKGKTDPVAAWRLLGIGEDERHTTGAAADLVGRDAELADLLTAYERVVAGRRPAMVTITGAAGIGKSRLARALVERLSDRAAVVAGRCLPYGEGITYWPLAEIVRRLAGRAEETAIAEAAGGGPEGQAIAERLVRVIGIATGGVPVEEAHWAARRLLEIRAAQRPLIVMIDDLHWAEPSLLDLVEHVVTLADEVPLLLICLARTELHDRRPTWFDHDGRTSELALGPLAPDDAATLLDQLTAGAGVEPIDASQLLETAEGNPFFLEQIVAMRAEPGDAATRTPASIHALLAARIDALPHAERAVIDRAAVEGRGFHRSAVAELLEPGERADLDVTLEALARRRLITPGAGELPGEAGYRFVHILVRDVAYELLPKAIRATLHERYAAWLDERAGARYEELVGYHLEQAHRLQSELRPSAGAERRSLAAGAARRLSAAGRAALDRGDLPAGVNLLERTAALLPPDDPARAPVLPELGLALVQLGLLPEAESLLIEAARSAAEYGDPLAEAHARTAQFFAVVQVQPEAAADDLSRRFDALQETFARASDDLGLARLWRARALVHWLNGNTAKAVSAWSRGERHARQAGDEQGRADALVWLSSAYSIGPTRVPVAIQRCERILEQLEYDRRSQALAMRALASLHAMAGRFDAARDLFARGQAIHDDLGVSMHAAAAHDEAFVARLAGDPATAEALLRPGCDYLQSRGERALLATTAGMLAEALLEQGQDAEASTYTDIAAEDAAPDDLAAQVLWRSVRARLLTRDGDPDEADRLSAEAVELAAKTDFVLDHADTLMARGEVLRAIGQPDGATRSFRKALELYDRKGNVVAAQRARRVVDERPAWRSAGRAR
jgi:predicted ATPase/class 3 adenylate cyclase